jgi:hypothetical protein
MEDGGNYVQPNWVPSYKLTAWFHEPSLNIIKVMFLA